MKPFALISPSSRGIGLHLARRLLQTTNVPIVATARKDVAQTRENVLSGLHDVQGDRLHVLTLDVLEEDSVADAAEQLAKLLPKKENYLHLSLAIPGILINPEKSPAQINYDDTLLTFRTNTLGPMLLLKHFAPFLPKKATQLETVEGLPKTAVWANMSARVGSITDNRLGGWYSYRASKAAVNQLTKSFDNYLLSRAGENAMSISLHPGTVKTDLSKEFWGNVKDEKLFTPEFSAEKLLEVVNNRSLHDRGKCWDWEGKEVPP